MKKIILDTNFLLTHSILSTGQVAAGYINELVLYINKKRIHKLAKL